ncbi:hypothetical protein AB0B25_08955 [Nocardia sp. NPDC049190]|uniref:hypothetical protein n=1 Tax=Nocardia sp. NPDC049190 TaxID=3155650 RepID=UPI0033E505D8
MTTADRTVLAPGATGQQGGPTIRHLPCPSPPRPVPRSGAGLAGDELTPHHIMSDRPADRT